MNKSDFFSNLINYSKREGFSFFLPGEDSDDPEKFSERKQVAHRAAFAVTSGIISAIAGVNYRFIILGGLNPSQLSIDY
jgi:hypothetical protein